MTLRNTWLTTFMLTGVVALAGCSSSSNTPSYNGGGGYGASGTDAGTGGSSGGSGTGGNVGLGGSAGSGGTGTAGSGGTGTAGSGGTGTAGSGGTGTAGSGGTTGTDAGTAGSGGTTGTDAGTAGSGGTTGTDAGTAGSGGTTGTDAGTAGSGGTSTGGSAGTDAGQSCTQITVGTFAGNNYYTDAAQISPNIGGTAADWLAVAQNGTTGTFNLANETDLTTCTQCVLAYEDVTSSSVARYYFQTSGSMTVSQSSSSTPVFSSGSLSNVKLVEVTIDSTGKATPVPNGKCLILNSANWSVANACNDGGPEYTGVNQSSTTDCSDCTGAEEGTGGCCAAPTTTCSNNNDCVSLVTCANNCASGDTTCQTNCYNQYPNGQADFENLVTCLFGNGTTTVGACGLACP